MIDSCSSLWRIGVHRGAAMVAWLAGAAVSAGQGTEVIWRIRAHDLPVSDVAVSWDGALVGSAPACYYGGEAGFAGLWDAATGEARGRINPVGFDGLSGVEFSPTEPRAVVINWDLVGTRSLHSLPDGSLIRVLRDVGYGIDTQFSPDGERFVIGSGGAHLFSGFVTAFESTTGEFLWSMWTRSYPAWATWSTDGRRIGVAAGSAYIVDAADGSVLREFGASAFSAAWGPGDRWIALGEYPGTPVVLLDPDSGDEVGSLPCESALVLRASPDRSLLAGCGGRTATFWRTSDLAEIAAMRIDGIVITNLAFAPDGTSVAIALESGEVALARTPRLCPADCDRSGTVAAADFVCFQAAWQAREGYADFDGSGRWDVNDFIAFYREALAPCP